MGILSFLKIFSIIIVPSHAFPLPWIFLKLPCPSISFHGQVSSSSFTCQNIPVWIPSLLSPQIKFLLKSLFTFILSNQLQLALEQRGFELCRSTCTWIFSVVNTKIQSWLNPQIRRNHGYRGPTINYMQIKTPALFEGQL